MFDLKTLAIITKVASAAIRALKENT